MDLLALIPPQYAVYALALAGICSVITATFPAPTKPAWAVIAWKALNFVAANVGHARNQAAQK